jgi:hypothetical protein
MDKLFLIILFLLLILYLTYIYGRIPYTSYWYVKKLMNLFKKLGSSKNQIEFQEYSTDIRKLKKEIKENKLFNKCKKIIHKHKLEKFLDVRYFKNKLSMLRY